MGGFVTLELLDAVLDVFNVVGSDTSHRSKLKLRLSNPRTTLTNNGKFGDLWN
jgi:hypothetical protein